MTLPGCFVKGLTQSFSLENPLPCNRQTRLIFKAGAVIKHNSGKPDAGLEGTKQEECPGGPGRERTPGDEGSREMESILSERCVFRSQAPGRTKHTFALESETINTNCVPPISIAQC